MCRTSLARLNCSLVVVAIGLAGCNSSSLTVDLGTAADLTYGGDLAAPHDAGPEPDLGGAVDLAVPDDLLALPDLVPPRDLPPNAFAATLGGIWLVGFSGGLDHFTWIRFDVKNPDSGPADFLEATGRPGWVGYWMGCEGTGQWALTQKPDTVQLKFPAKCNLPDIVFTFQNVQRPMGGFPPGALLEATFDPSPPAPPNGYKYPDQQCDPQFTACTLP